MYCKQNKGKYQIVPRIKLNQNIRMQQVQYMLKAYTPWRYPGALRTRNWESKKIIQKKEVARKGSL